MESRSQPTYLEKQVLVTVKAYPNPSRAYRETVCVAGVTDEAQFIRLFPVCFRDLENDNQFKTFTWIHVRVFKTHDDKRPESFHLDPDWPIAIGSAVSTKNDWEGRKRWLDPLRSPTLEGLHAAQKINRTSLGLLRPRADWELIIEPEPVPNWNADEIAKLTQQELFARPHTDRTRPVKLLEKIPVRIAYRFHCDDSACNGHNIKVISWEVLESWRKYRRKYGSALGEIKFRDRYVDWMRKRDMQFLMGNMLAHPSTFLIIGLFYPPRQGQGATAHAVPVSLW